MTSHGSSVRSERNSLFANLTRPDWILAGLLSLIFLAHALVYARNTPIGVPPDEWAHLSHVKEVADGPGVLPDQVGSRILPDKTRLNYLGHPPLYYTVLGLIGRVTGWDVEDDIESYRSINALLVTLGVFIWAIVARIWGFTRASVVALTIGVNLIPIFPYLAGSVNNDNLAYFAAAIAFLGISILPTHPKIAFYVAATGVTIALLTKATVALFLAAFLLAWTPIQAKARLLQVGSAHFIIPMLLMTSLAGAYYLYALVEFGSLFPRPGDLYISNPVEPGSMEFRRFLALFFGTMGERLPVILSHEPTQPLAGAPALSLLFYGWLLLPVLAWAFSFIRFSRPGSDAVVISFTIALIAMVGFHIYFVWMAYFTYGILPGVQPRYYLFLIPAIFLIGFLSYRNSRLVCLLLAAFTGASYILGMTVPFRALRVESARHAPQPLPAVIRLHRTPAQNNRVLRLRFPRRPAGNVDTLEKRLSVVYIRGWAVDVAARAPARRVELYYNGELLGGATPQFSRPDVADALDIEDAETSGFEFHLTDAPKSLSACDVQVVAVHRDGSASELSGLSCQ